MLKWREKVSFMISYKQNCWDFDQNENLEKNIHVYPYKGSKDIQLIDDHHFRGPFLGPYHI